MATGRDTGPSSLLKKQGADESLHEHPPAFEDRRGAYRSLERLCAAAESPRYLPSVGEATEQPLWRETRGMNIDDASAINFDSGRKDV